MVKIACVGIAVQDKIYYVDSIPHTAGKFVASDYKEIGGGPAATAAVAIAKLGGQVDFIGRVGDDATGQVILSELENYHVNTKLTKIYKNARSSQSAILVDKTGERLIVNYPSPDLSNETTWLDTIDFSQYDVILADVRWHQGTEYCFNKAKQLGIVTILDADTTPQDINSLVKLSTYSVFSEPGLIKTTSETHIEQALSNIDAITEGQMFVTLGSNGCKWIANEKLHHHHGINVDVIDTTGAGDVFHGAFAFAIATGYLTEKAIEFANVVAALKCTKSGGRAGIPTLAQVNSFMKNQ